MKIFTRLLSFVVMLGLTQTGLLAQETVKAQVYLTFEDGVIIPDDAAGVSIIEGQNNINAKVDGEWVVDIAPLPNEIVDFEGDKALFLDYEGYLKFDESILNKTNFTFITDFQFTGNGVWWMGILQFTGYDEDGPADDGIEPGYSNPQLQIKNPGAGLLNGLNCGDLDVGMKQDTTMQLAITCDSGNVVIYLDGDTVGFSSPDNGMNIHNLVDPVLYLGAKLTIDEFGTPTPGIDGNGNCKNTKNYIDNVALFDTVLSYAEIKGIYEGTTEITLPSLPTIESTEYTVNSTALTITGVPGGTTLADFEANLTVSEGATLVTYEADGITEATDILTGYKTVVTNDDGSVSYTVTVAAPLANNSSSINKLEIYPNPVKNQLFLNSNEVNSVEIYNMVGVKVLTARNTSNQIDVSDLRTGVYMVKCIDNTNNTISINRIIKN